MEASASLHEPAEKLRSETLEMHRALVSLMEELEAIDWYAQRVDASSDPDLRAVLQHNMEEEMEHAAMVLEWVRRHSPAFERQLREYLFRQGDITAEEEDAEGGEAAPGRGAGSLGIGSLRGEARRRA